MEDKSEKIAKKKRNKDNECLCVLILETCPSAQEPPSIPSSYLLTVKPLSFIPFSFSNYDNKDFLSFLLISLFVQY